jgi:hypothetical protein
MSTQTTEQAAEDKAKLSEEQHVVLDPIWEYIGGHRGMSNPGELESLKQKIEKAQAKFKADQESLLKLHNANPNDKELRAKYHDVRLVWSELDGLRMRCQYQLEDTFEDCAKYMSGQIATAKGMILGETDNECGIPGASSMFDCTSRIDSQNSLEKDDFLGSESDCSEGAGAT